MSDVEGLSLLYGIAFHKNDNEHVEQKLDQIERLENGSSIFQ